MRDQANQGWARSAWSLLWSRPRVAAALSVLGLIFAACVVTLPWLVSSGPADPTPRYNAGTLEGARVGPSLSGPSEAGQDHAPMSVGFWLLGTDGLGRSLLYRLLVGGAISLTVGIAAAIISVAIGTVYGAVSGLAGGRVDALLMRAVDVLYGLPYILLVVLLAVAIDAAVERFTVSRVLRLERERIEFIERAVADASGTTDPDGARQRATRDALARHGTGELSQVAQHAINITTLLVAIGSVSWLTLARVVRGEVLSLKARPFVEAARSIGVSRAAILVRHLLPNLAGPIIVYATLAVPQAILQESFLSFLGIGIRPPLPSWGNLAADGLSEINPYKSHWWLIAFPCLMLGVTLVSLNLVGDGLRDVLDPRSRDRRA